MSCWEPKCTFKIKPVWGKDSDRQRFRNDPIKEERATGPGERKDVSKHSNKSVLPKGLGRPGLPSRTSLCSARAPAVWVVRPWELSLLLGG